MRGDKKYEALRMLIDSGSVKNFTDFFDIINKTMLKDDLGSNTVRINSLLKNIGGFEIQEMFDLAELIGVDPRKLTSLFVEQYFEEKLRRSKSQINPSKH